MKKVFPILAIFSLLFIPLVSVYALPGELPAQCTIPDTKLQRINNLTPGVTCEEDCDFEQNPDCGVCCMMLTVVTVTDWIFIFLMAIVIIFVLLGAFFILTAGGDTEKVNKGRNFIIYAAIGLLVALLARAVPALVRVMGGF